MRLEEVIDPDCGLQQDEVSSGSPTFGEGEHLQIIGWSGFTSNNRRKYYIVKCAICEQDPKLFGDGVFKILLTSLKRGVTPCGCMRNPMWTKEQYEVRCKRKCSEIGYEFVGFVGKRFATSTRVKLRCDRHGQWCSTRLDNLLSKGTGCPKCRSEEVGKRSTKDEEDMIQSFRNSGGYHPDTSFKRLKQKKGVWRVWSVKCGECGQKYKSTSGQLSNGARSCACSPMRQQETYINWVVDNNNNAVAIKFGIAVNSQRRAKVQNSKSIYEIRNYLVYEFPTVEMCKKAERMCKRKLECGVIPKTNMPDGYTETTSVLNLAKVKKIFEECGGVEIENNA